MPKTHVVVRYHASNHVTEALLVANGTVTLIASGLVPADVDAMAADFPHLSIDVRPGAFRVPLTTAA